MKKIKIKICDYDQSDEFSFGYFICGVLGKYYEVELSEEPDYLFYNEATYEYLNYDCVRIFFTGENITPNFNFCDYAIGFDWLNFGDRYFRLPLYLITVFYSKDELVLAGDLDFKTQINFSAEDLTKKSGFCSFVYSNYLADNSRKDFFDRLNKYKKVDAGGKYLNNVGGRVANKLEFEMSHKFSIAFENTSRSGYTTEKLVASLAAKTIPIYWGNPDIGREFNTKRFINCHEFNDFDEVVARVKKIDNDNQLYLNIY
ncbi:MAG: glycosyltransferase family 10, partial [Candidatus Falkowbacteria bacterium]